MHLSHLIFEDGDLGHFWVAVLVHLSLLLLWSLNLSKRIIWVWFGLEANEEVAQNYFKVTLLQVNLIIDLELNIKLLVFFLSSLPSSFALLWCLFDRGALRMLSLDQQRAFLGNVAGVWCEYAVTIRLKVKSMALLGILSFFGVGYDIWLVQCLDDCLRDLNAIVYRGERWQPMTSLLTVYQRHSFVISLFLHDPLWDALHNLVTFC